jgi:hypothetical protein
VGIGTTSPAYKLNIVDAKTLTPTTGDGQIAIDNSTASQVSAMLFSSQGTRRAQISSGLGGSGNDGYLAFTTRSDSTGFGERMRIDSSGNLLLGTTSGSGARLDVIATNVVLGSNGIQKIGADSSGADIGGQITFSNINARRAAIAGRQESTDAIAGYLQFGTRGTSGDITERMRIDSSGNLSLGTTSVSGGRLTVKAATSSGANAMQVKDNADTIRMELADNGYIRFPAVYSTYTTGGAANLYIYTDGGLYRSTSSLKYKKNVVDATHGLVDLLKLRPVTYEGKSEMDSGKTFGGLIAEEVHDAGLTEFVQYAEDGSPDALAYGNMVSLCIKAIQELKAINDTQAEIITQLQADVATLKGNV